MNIINYPSTKVQFSQEHEYKGTQKREQYTHTIIHVYQKHRENKINYFLFLQGALEEAIKFPLRLKALGLLEK